ncbi:putative cadherin domain protein, partial [Trichinella spiralis]|uniref:putative cadherin domain protein n=1 Tax=Trichinella spiralis TaxID=6334 RepID=UPI0001EFC12F
VNDFVAEFFTSAARLRLGTSTAYRQEEKHILAGLDVGEHVELAVDQPAQRFAMFVDVHQKRYCASVAFWPYSFAECCRRPAHSGCRLACRAPTAWENLELVALCALFCNAVPLVPVDRTTVDRPHISNAGDHAAIVAADESPLTAVPLDVVVELLSGGKISPATDFASIIGLVGRNAGTAVHHLAMAVTFVCGAEQFQADQTFEPFFGR